MVEVEDGRDMEEGEMVAIQREHTITGYQLDPDLFFQTEHVDGVQEYIVIW